MIQLKNDDYKESLRIIEAKNQKLKNKLDQEKRTLLTEHKAEVDGLKSKVKALKKENKNLEQAN